MDKHVLAAALRLNEPVAFGRVEPLHCSGRHRRLLAPCLVNSRRESRHRVRVLGYDLGEQPKWEPGKTEPKPWLPSLYDWGLHVNYLCGILFALEDRLVTGDQRRRALRQSLDHAPNGGAVERTDVEIELFRLHEVVGVLER